MEPLNKDTPETGGVGVITIPPPQHIHTCISLHLDYTGCHNVLQCMSFLLFLQRFHVLPLLKDSMIRDFVWDSKGSKLFYGDDVGRLGVAYIPKQKLFKKPDEICLVEKSSIVQLVSLSRNYVVCVCLCVCARMCVYVCVHVRVCV